MSAPYLLLPTTSGCLGSAKMCTIPPPFLTLAHCKDLHTFLPLRNCSLHTFPRAGAEVVRTRKVQSKSRGAGSAQCSLLERKAKWSYTIQYTSVGWGLWALPVGALPGLLHNHGTHTRMHVKGTGKVCPLPLHVPYPPPWTVRPRSCSLRGMMRGTTTAEPLTTLRGPRAVQAKPQRPKAGGSPPGDSLSCPPGPYA